MADCEACCTDDGGASTLDNVKYERAILEVCGWRLGAYPQVGIPLQTYFSNIELVCQRLRRSSRASDQRGILALPSSMWGVRTQSLRWDPVLMMTHTFLSLAFSINSYNLSASWWRWGGGGGACHQQVEHGQCGGVPWHCHGEERGGGSWYHREPDLNILTIFSKPFPEHPGLASEFTDSTLPSSDPVIIIWIVLNWHYIVPW